MELRIFVIVWAISASLMAADIQVIEQIVAKVNGDIITRGELDTSRRTLEAQVAPNADTTFPEPGLPGQWSPRLALRGDGPGTRSA